MYHKKDGRIAQDRGPVDIGRRNYGINTFGDLMVLDKVCGKHCMKLRGSCTACCVECQGPRSYMPELYPIYRSFFCESLLTRAATINTVSNLSTSVKSTYLVMAKNAQEEIWPLLSVAQLLKWSSSSDNTRADN